MKEIEYIKQCVNSKDFCGMLMTKDKIKLLLNEIERLNNIINKLEKYLKNEYLKWKDSRFECIRAQAEEDKDILDKLKKLRGEDK